MRLNKFLAESGFGARRKVEELIKSGKVKINNTPVTELSTQVDPEKDTVVVGGQPALIETKVYIMLNKPPGYLSTVLDERGRKTVLDLIKVEQRIFPVGRLDKDSRGLLLLTNDGDLSARLLHPRYKVSKTYIVKADATLTKDELDRFATGLKVEGKKTAPAKIKIIHNQRSTINYQPSYEVTLKEGRKRQIRLMFDALGRKTLDLKRIALGPLTLDDLREGEWRHLSREELKKLEH